MMFKTSVPTAMKIQHVSNTEVTQLIYFREIIAVYSENHMKLINTLCGKHAELLDVKAGGTYTYHCVLKG
jgi:lipoate-protein ligase B